MLLIEDIHIVIGRDEIPFDDTYRSELAPRIAEAPGTRLAGFFWAPHGGGEGYEAVTLTAVTDTPALERHQERLATGDLAELWGSLEAKQRSIVSSLNVRDRISVARAPTCSTTSSGSTSVISCMAIAVAATSIESGCSRSRTRSAKRP